MLNYRRQTALWVRYSFGQKWKTRTETIFYGHYRSTFNQCNSVKKTPNKGYYGVQGHSRSSRSIPIESPYATSYYLLIVTGILSRTVSELSQPIFFYKFWTLFAPSFGCVGTTDNVHLGLIGKSA